MRILLIPFSLIYYIIISVRGFFYSRGIFKTHSLNAKVISIGNITWGGTGKTPAVLYIAEFLAKENHNVAVLSRGYAKDEQDLFSKLAKDIPLVAGRDRVKSGKKAIDRYSVDTLLLDDGFQHRRLSRDLDIVCIDATNPFGNRCLIPAGSMRERLTGLKRADILLLTKADLIKDQKVIKRLEDKLKRINPDALIVKAIHSPKYFYRLRDEQLINIETVRNKNIALVSALGNPRSFEKTVLNMELKFKKHFIFRDHHSYAAEELRKIEDYCIKKGIDTLITTEKDAVKLGNGNLQLSKVNVLVLGVRFKIIENEKGFYNRLSGIYSS